MIFRVCLLMMLLTGTRCWALLPTELMCNLYAKPGLMTNSVERPEFSWCFKQAEACDIQTSYQIQVATETRYLRTDAPDLWDSGRVNASQSVFICYGGGPLPAGRQICWRVRVWDRGGHVGPWSYTAAFMQAETVGSSVAMQPYAVVQTVFKPQRIVSNHLHHVCVDFGRRRIGWLEIIPSYTGFEADTGAYTLHLGEVASADQQVLLNPPDPYRAVTLKGYLVPAAIFRYPFPQTLDAARDAVPLSAEVGTVMPFRYVEIEKSSVAITKESLRQVMVHYPFDDKASAFVCDRPELDRVYTAAKQTIKTLSYTGRYIEDDLNRCVNVPAAYVAQLGHACVDREFTMARNTLDALISHPSDVLQWRQLMIDMVWTEWMYTGNTNGLSRWYAQLSESFLANALVRSDDGLVVTGTNLVTRAWREQVDLTEAQSDGFQMGSVQAVANALYYRNLVCMQQIAEALGRQTEAVTYAALAQKVAQGFHKAFYDLYLGRYVDHVGARHASLHANMYALACGVVPETEKQRIAHVLTTYGMACSPFAAQFLLEALFNADQEETAIQLLTAKGPRGWYAMSQDGRDLVQSAWNAHPTTQGGLISVLGAVPANIIPRYVLGVRPLKPGFEKILIRPQAGTIDGLQGSVPTIRGTVTVGVRQKKNHHYKLMVSIPVNTTARVELPPLRVEEDEISVDGRKRQFSYANGRIVIDDLPSGEHVVEWNKK